jgi:RNA-directed DNA polymerase
LDEQIEGDPSYFYRRFMDDVIILAKTRLHLRKAVRIINQHFNQLKVEQAPDKTYISKISKGFDFLGYQFGKEKITVSKRTLESHIRRLTQLYEQKRSHPNWMALLDDYRQRWVTWVYSGIPSSIIMNILLAKVGATKLADAKICNIVVQNNPIFYRNVALPYINLNRKPISKALQS